MKFTIPVKPRTKKNHAQLVTLRTGRQVLLPSKAYREFEKEVCDYMECTYGNLEPIDQPINLKCVFYRDANRKADLVGYLQAIQDALVKAKFLIDDNISIIESTDGSRVDLDRENPRIEVEITWKEIL